MYQKLTEKIAGKPEERILSYLMLRSLKQARYSEENLGHFALAATRVYAFHFADPALSRPDRAPHFERCAARSNRTTSQGRCRSARVPAASRRATSGGELRLRPGRSGAITPRTASHEPLHGPDLAGRTARNRRRIQPGGAARRRSRTRTDGMEESKFMEQHVGEDFDGLIISVTKFGMFRGVD